MSLKHEVIAHTSHNIGDETQTFDLFLQVDKVIVFERAGLLFIFNFHPTKSFADYRVGVEEAGEYKVALSSDEKRFGGFDRIDLNGRYHTTALEWNNRKNFLQAS